MPIAYVVDLTKWMVRARASSPMSFEDMRDFFSQSNADVRVHPDMVRWFDMRGVTELPSSVDLRRLADIVNRSVIRAVGLIAVLVDSDLGHGIAKMLGGLTCCGTRLEVFRSDADALAWLVAEVHHTPAFAA